MSVIVEPSKEITLLYPVVIPKQTSLMRKTKKAKEEQHLQ